MLNREKPDNFAVGREVFIMKVTGIIAEYNPFQKGHKYLIDCKKKLNSDYVIVAMSGDYVQRGTCASSGSMYG